MIIVAFEIQVWSDEIGNDKLFMLYNSLSSLILL